MIRRLLIVFVVLMALAPALSHAQSDTPTEPIRVWIGWELPREFEAMLSPLLADPNYQRTFDQQTADIRLSVGASNSAIRSEWLYVPVVPFASTTETISYADLLSYWQGDSFALNNLSGTGEPVSLLVTDEILSALQLILGPASLNAPYVRVPDDQLITKLWEQRPTVWAIVPFQYLTPEMKVLKLDGVDIFSPNFDPSTYPLRMTVGVEGDEAAIGRTIVDLQTIGTWRASNRNAERLSRVVLSGVTALTRTTADVMVNSGDILLPSEGIMDFVADADIFHTSNEVSFSDQCPRPQTGNVGTTSFCAYPEFMELFTHLGIDVMELTGNHLNDRGPGAFRATLDLYDDVGIQYFGGGRDLESSRQPVIFESNGNTIAFLGCNFYDTNQGYLGPLAGEERAGASPCDMTYIEQELGRLSQEVDIVIMTIQDYENYRYDALPSQKERMAQFVAWGADVVIGSQAHQPHGFDIISRDGQTAGFVHHGLGNLFFDQMAQIGTRQMFMDKVIVHEGQVISVELYTGLIENYCCPRPMTEDERADFLRTLFEANGW